LSSSPASSLKSVSRSLSTPLLHAKAGGFFEEPEVMIRKNSDAGLTPPLEGELKLCQPIPRSLKEKLEDCAKENGLSLGYILERMSLEELRPTEPMAKYQGLGKFHGAVLQQYAFSFLRNHGGVWYLTIVTLFRLLLSDEIGLV
jgi:hypothetical protein